MAIDVFSLRLGAWRMAIAYRNHNDVSLDTCILPSIIKWYDKSRPFDVTAAHRYGEQR
jgi:hypothetical protein